MRHLLLALWLLLLPTAAAAQWSFAENSDGALAWVNTAAGSSIYLRCQPGAAQAGRMRVELIVWPSNTREPTEEVARISAGRYTFSLELEPEGPAFVNRRLYVGRFEFDHPIMVNFRAQLAAANVAVLEDAFDFRGDRFGLRGSRAAISQLEAACPRVWDRRAALAVTTSRWTISGDRLSASVTGPGGARFGIGCVPSGRVTDLRWTVDLPIRGGLSDTNPTLTARASDRTRIAFGEAMDNSGSEHDPRRPYPYAIPLRPGPMEAFLKAIEGWAIWIDFAETASTQAVRFSLAGAKAAVSAVLDTCGYETPS